MNNSEKYRFEDFTIKNYRRLVKTALDRGFVFVTFEDDIRTDRKEVLWRHDVEFEPDKALCMAEIESEAGVGASYFFQVHSQFYNLYDAHYTEVFRKIRGLGHQVGLHFDSHYWNITDESQLNDYIRLDREYFERVLQVKIKAFSFHNTTSFTSQCLAQQYGGLINVYSSFFKQNYTYCSDSLGYWRYDRLEDVLNDDSVSHLHVLTHDANWSDSAMSPRKRFSHAMHNHADRLIQEQADFLHGQSLLFPDDETE